MSQRKKSTFNSLESARITTLLIMYLKDVAKSGDGSIAQLSEMSELCKCHISRSDDRLRKALKSVFVEHRCVFEAIPGVGYSYVKYPTKNPVKQRLFDRALDWRERYKEISLSQLSAQQLEVYAKDYFRLLHQEKNCKN